MKVARSRREDWSERERMHDWVEGKTVCERRREEKVADRGRRSLSMRAEAGANWRRGGQRRGQAVARGAADGGGDKRRWTLLNWLVV